ncbi:class I SAM-dependent methyltransferase [Schaalia sp. lx-260]|uniref:class I SAM-dependent methyltransferase n=1 Tax=Schaalia sp. lx-260 TaxID=2899082 RepID=UPI001E38E98E|nr:class I SAM-dependent methyltransferase [Schaalia sp. lx-260]
MDQQQYFTSSAPATDNELRVLRATARGHDLEMWVSDKVFSSGRIDLGTRQLLAEAPALPDQGFFLDLGCGWGPLAITMALESTQAHVWAVDVNERALDLTARNAVHNEVEDCVEVLDATRALERAHAENLRFDVIWSNPPVRIGKEAMHTMLTSWLSLLAPTGRAYLVVQKNLGADSLITWLSSVGFPAQKIASKKGYRIIEVLPHV